MTKLTGTLTLNTGAKIPQVGLGTWLSNEEEGYQAVLTALKAGYRHIDTAAFYKNEVSVGRAIRESGIPREEIFVTTKLTGTQHREPKKALEESLERLGLDYVDLYLMHWPIPLKKPTVGDYLRVPLNPDGSRALDNDWDFVKTWELLQELPQTGLTRAVGVSNFSIKNLETLLSDKRTHLTPAVNQVESHPLLPQFELIQFCQWKGIVLEAYSPLGSANSNFFSDEFLKGIAETYKCSVAQLLINWGLSRGIVVLPKSSNPERIVSNLESVEISENDLESVGHLVDKYGEKRYVNPDWSPFPTFQ
ncbi:uncharacterized protein CYBJADRAFT_169225 [Cyberlindnera jadinii NRRL Y-1542]|uniref:NADP-dependent oxidoreductase domain-containing protein n=1 Tax=Cyberlindnera jadinii (strain ATCC 18201 / CBS 1600 / BCRC 20928 / JCM 3617 / NBRC 0987 / NRRL Y-1542) TaxID=983966 RepID=A0A1E4RWC9_CYBJN|nr:hypothetical protein CYBJADRAFT_169225 [Cyberlindnera jadinii NRRL Y-1542]ODV71592.1 hypothetical protein CYBJADRAFT_169225 [Cyberlindnera jadinii NRRL Y-1542]